MGNVPSGNAGRYALKARRPIVTLAQDGACLPPLSSLLSADRLSVKECPSQSRPDNGGSEARGT